MADRYEHPDWTRRLREPSWSELRLLRHQVRERTRQTPLERVAQEVGETVYTVMMRELLETTIVMSRHEPLGLTPALYLHLLQLACRDIRAAERRRSAGRAPVPR